MQSELPKVLISLHGKPLAAHVLDAVKDSGIDPRPIMVVGQQRELVIKTLGDRCEYVVQEEQLGTGHAVSATSSLLKDKCENILVLYGDMPFVTGKTIRNIFEFHETNKNHMTMGTVTLENFEDWRKAFYSFGRIVRDQAGKLRKIVYGKNLTPEELKITEVDPAFFCFKASWLWPRLGELKNENSHQEYYLTDLVGMAVSEGTPPATISIPTKEALGVNSKEDLETLEKFKV